MRINNRIDQTYDELQVGQIFRSGGRTVTETDVVNFCALTGNWIEIHSNVKYASKTRSVSDQVQKGNEAKKVKRLQSENCQEKLFPFASR